MASLSGFNAAEVEPTTGFDCVPAGDYDVVIMTSEMKTTKDGSGQYLKLEFAILNGQFQNRKIFTNLNLVNKNETAVKIGKANLSAICRALQVLTPNDSSELHGKPMTVRVTIRKSDEYDDQNEIRSFKPKGAAPPVNAPVATTAATQPAPWVV